MTSDEEGYWIQGQRAALRTMLAHVLKQLGYEDTEETRSKWVMERETTVSMLRDVCEQFGDNDWPNKHLMRYLDPNDDVDIHTGSTIYARVIAAMQEAEEIDGPNTPAEYIDLMTKIAAEATRRAEVALQREMGAGQ